MWRACGIWSYLEVRFEANTNSQQKGSAFPNPCLHTCPFYEHKQNTPLPPCRLFPHWSAFASLLFAIVTYQQRHLQNNFLIPVQFGLVTYKNVCAILFNASCDLCKSGVFILCLKKCKFDFWAVGFFYLTL